MIQCSFANHEDLDKVLETSPWSVRGAHVVLKKWPANSSINDIDFLTSEFLVQIHNLPPNRVNLENAKRIGKFLGKFVKWGFDLHPH